MQIARAGRAQIKVSKTNDTMEVEIMLLALPEHENFTQTLIVTEVTVVIVQNATLLVEIHYFDNLEMAPTLPETAAEIGLRVAPLQDHKSLILVGIGTKGARSGLLSYPHKKLVKALTLNEIAARRVWRGMQLPFFQMHKNLIEIPRLNETRARALTDILLPFFRKHKVIVVTPTTLEIVVGKLPSVHLLLTSPKHKNRKKLLDLSPRTATQV